MTRPTPAADLLYRLLFALILAGALALRLLHLGTPQLWEDDYLNLDRASLDPAKLIAIQNNQGPADTIFDLQPPLTYLLVHAALAVSDTTLAARVPSLAAGLLSILAIGGLGRLAGGRRAGLAAAAFAALSLFHLDFSRAIKLYALFLAALTMSLFTLLRLLMAPPDKKSSPGLLLGYTLATAAMLTSGYQGAPALFGEGLVIGGMFCGKRGQFAGKTRWRRLLPLAGAMAIGLAVWLPLAAPGLLFLRRFLAAPGINLWQGLSPAFFASIVTGFLHQHTPVPLWCTLFLLGLLGLGLWRGRRLPLLLLFTAGLVPALAVLTSQSMLRPLVSWRHLVCLFPLLTVALGTGAAAAAALALKRAPFGHWRPGLAVLLTGALCVLGLAPSLPHLGDATSQTKSYDRDLFRYISRLPVPFTSLTFTGYQRNTARFAARWHLPGRFTGPGDFDGPGYGRTLIVDRFTEASNRLRAAPRGTLLASWGLGLFHTRLALAGLPRRAPLLLAADAAAPDQPVVYHDDFHDWRYYRDAFTSHNFFVDTEVGLLRPERYETPATAVWRFDLPPGTTGAQVTAHLTAALYKRDTTLPADSQLTIAASTDGRTFTRLGSLSGQDFLAQNAVKRRFFEEIGFYQATRQATADLDLTPFAATGSVYVRVDYTPGVREGFLNLAALTVTAHHVLPADPLAFYAANLARNCNASAWRPGEHLLGPAAYVFAAPAHAALATTLPEGQVIGTPAALTAFEAAHPGLAPAFILRDAAGNPAVVVHDPGLAPDGDAPLLTDAAPVATLRLATTAPVSVGTAWIWGKIHTPTLRLGPTSLPLPISAPAGSVLRLTPGADGTLTFSPNFDPPDFTDTANAHFRNMAPSRSYPEYAGGLTCQPNTYCSFDYVLVSGLPIRELRLLTYPRLYGDPGNSGRCQVAVSTDGKNFDTVVDFHEAPPADWTPMFTRRYAKVRFAKPATFVTMRFSLFANATAEFWSPPRPVDKMLVEADLDARILAPLRLTPGPIRVELAGGPGNALHVAFDPKRPGLERVWPGQ